MGFINFAEKTINAKLVYYGVGMGGKTTSLQAVHSFMVARNEVQLVSIKTEGDATLLFDFLPINLGQVEICGRLTKPGRAMPREALAAPNSAEELASAAESLPGGGVDSRRSTTAHSHVRKTTPFWSGSAQQASRRYQYARPGRPRHPRAQGPHRCARTLVRLADNHQLRRHRREGDRIARSL
jgi:hypothetical protein